MKYINILMILLTLKSFSQSQINGSFFPNKKIFVLNDIYQKTDSIVSNHEGKFSYLYDLKTVEKKKLKFEEDLILDFYLFDKQQINIDIIKTNGKYQIKLNGQCSNINQFWVDFWEIESNWEILPYSDAFYDLSKDNILPFLEKLNLKQLTHQVKENKYFDKQYSQSFNDSIKSIQLLQLDVNAFKYLYQYLNMNDFSIEKQLDYFKQLNLLLIENPNNQLFNFNQEFIGFAAFELLELKFEQELFENKNQNLSKIQYIDKLFTGDLRKEVLLTKINDRLISDTYEIDELNIFLKLIQTLSSSEEVFKRGKTILSQIDYVKSTIGHQAPVFELNDENGLPYSLNDFKGQVILIGLWASWCGPCKTNMIEMKKVRDYYKNKHLTLLNIAVWEKRINEENSKKRRVNFLKNNAIDWISLVDKDDFIIKNYKPDSIPRYILIDKNGNVISFDAPSPFEFEKLVTEIDKIIF